MKELKSCFIVRTVQSLDHLQRVWSFAAPNLNLPAGRHTLQYYTEQFATTPQLMVVAEHDQRICGCVLASVEDDHVLVGPVAERSRRKGIGSAMMQEVEARARELGWSKLMLRTPEIDRELQEKYDRAFSSCSTQYVFIKRISC